MLLWKKEGVVDPFAFLYYLLCSRIISINRCLSYISFPFLGNIVYCFLVIAPLAEWTVKDLWDFACDMLVYFSVSHVDKLHVLQFQVGTDL